MPQPALWVVPTPTDEQTDAGTLRKAAAAKMYAAFDFGNFDELLPAGNDIASATVSGSTVTITGTDYSSGYRVCFYVAGGTAGNTYTLTCSATLADGSILVGSGSLAVR